MQEPAPTHDERPTPTAAAPAARWRRAAALLAGLALLLGAGILLVNWPNAGAEALGCDLRCCAASGADRCPDAYYYSEAYLEVMGVVRERMAKAAALQPGDHVADLGAGWGFVTTIAADAVGADGLVWATDIDPTRISELDAEYSAQQRRNIRTVLVRDPWDTGLGDAADGSLAAIFVINSINLRHDGDLPQQIAYLRGLFQKLRVGGAVYYHTDWIDDELASRADVVERFAAAGFREPPRDLAWPGAPPARTCYCTRMFRPTVADLGYLLVFRRPAAPAP